MSAGRYKIKTVAELFDLSPTLLRAWERRYELLEPERLPSGHRLYTEEDLAVLARVRELMQQGRSIGEIAAEGRERLLGQSRGPELAAVSEPPQEPPEEFQELHNDLLDAARKLDRARFAQLFAQACDTHGREHLMLNFTHLFLNHVGELWARGKLSVAAEHMVSAELRRWLQLAIAELPEPRSEHEILIAGLPDEYHELGLLLLHFVLLRDGVKVLYLGAAMPLEDLERAIQEAKRRAVLLSVTREAVFMVHYHRLFEVVQRCPGTKFFLGGQGVAARAADISWRGVQHWPQDRALSELGEILTR